MECGNRNKKVYRLTFDSTADILDIRAVLQREGGLTGQEINGRMEEFLDSNSIIGLTRAELMWLGMLTSICSLNHLHEKGLRLYNCSKNEEKSGDYA